MVAAWSGGRELGILAVGIPASAGINSGALSCHVVREHVHRHLHVVRDHLPGEHVLVVLVEGDVNGVAAAAHLNAGALVVERPAVAAHHDAVDLVRKFARGRGGDRLAGAEAVLMQTPARLGAAGLSA